MTIDFRGLGIIAAFVVIVTIAIISLAALVLMASSRSAKAFEVGIASVYSTKSSGARTASGRPLRDGELTAAHRRLPFGTMVKVTNKRNGRSANVMITDRGPFIRGRVIDLSMAGARAIGMGYGLATVSLETISQPRGRCARLAQGSNNW